ncbi:T9SS type A sorting domain-containing protein [bacterium]|nr:T9SS type A sorting domain-containing protein [bacterium]
MNPKNIFIPIISLAVLFAISNRAFCITHAAGLSDDARNYAQVVTETGSEIRIVFTPPESHQLLFSDYDPEASGYDLNGGYSTSSGINMPAITCWVVVPPRDRIELEIIRQRGRRLSTDIWDATVPFIDENVSTLRQEQLNGFNPPAAVKVGRPQVMRGIRMVPVTIFPLQVQTENNRAVENSEIEIELKFSAGEAVNPVIDLRPARFSHGMARILKDFTLNPPLGLSPHRDLAATELARMLILYPEAIDTDEEDEDAPEARAWIDSLAEWKRQMGYAVEIRPVDTEQDPDDIKLMIRDYYRDDGLEFLIIIGNEDSQELALEANEPRLYFPTSRFVIDIVEEVEIYGYSEHEYSLLDGNDQAPDIIVSRMKVPTYSRLIGVLQRSIAYEANPYTEDNNWFSKALLTVERENLNANDYALPYWTRSRLLREGYENIEILMGNNDWRIDDEDQVIRDEIRDAVEGGVSLVFGDGTLYGIANGRIVEIENRMVNDWEQWNDFAETGRMHPFVFANFSDYELHISYPFFASAKEDTLNGSIAMVGIYDKNGPSPKIKPIIGSAVRAITSDDIYSVGYIQLITKMHLLSIIECFDENDQGQVTSFIDALRLHWTLGDPTVDIFTSPPVELTVDHPDSFIEGETSVLLHVTDTEDNDIAGVTVCIRQPTDDGIQYVMESNSAGIAAFTVPAGLSVGELQITAHKHNSIPYRAELPVETVGMNLILAEYGFDDGDEGNDLFENGETVTLVLTLENSGEADAEEVTALLTCDSHWLNYDDESIIFTDIPSGETGGYEGEYLLDLHQNCPGGTLLRIQVDIYSGEEAISSAAFEITTSGPILTCDSIETDINFCGGGEGASFSPIITNLGDLTFSASTAVLESLDPLIEVTDAERNYLSIEPNDDEGMPSEPFYLNIDPLFVANNPASFELHISAEGEFDTTLTISKLVPGRFGGEPVGPDEYGYIAFDSNDYEDWYEAPWYWYYEINPDIRNYDFHGTKIEYESDGSSYWNETVLVELPFIFRYYGEDFRDITVCTNGWISMGDGGLPFSSPHNRPIPGIVAPDGQICILWQDLKNNARDYQYCGVYYHYAEEEDLFIIEWSNISVDNRVIVDDDSVRVDKHQLSFQILLYDPEVYPTESGDGEILFQYQNFVAATGNDDVRDHQYATVGIRNLDGEGGLQYAYGNVYAEGANPIVTMGDDGFAIKFTTAVENEYGSVTGTVLRAEGENESLEGVEIRHPRFSIARTAQDGIFRIRNLRASRYENVRVCKEGFNDQYISFTIEADQITEFGDIFMTHPELTIETEPADLEAISLRPDGTQLQVNLNLENDGNGPLEYEFTICNYDSSDIDYENIENWGLRDRLREPDCYGVVYVDSLFYILGRNNSERNGYGHRVYVVNRAGDTLRTFEQPMSNVSEHGLINITWDGQKFWGSIANFERSENLIISFDENGELISEIHSPFDYFGSMALTVNPETGNLFIADQNTGIVEINNEGEVQNEFDLHRPGNEFNVTALGWNSYDPEGRKLYIIEKYRPQGGGDARPVLYRMNHETGEYVESTILYRHNDPDSHRGMAVMHNFNNERTLIALVEGWGGALTPRDSLRFYDAGPNLSFMAEGIISDRIGIVDSLGHVRAGMLIDVDGWQEVTIPFGIKLLHNAGGESSIIQVQLHVDPDSDIPMETPITPTEFAITSVYPNPFNSAVRIGFAIDIAKPTTLKIYDLSGREVAVLYEGVPEAGYHQVTWDGAKIASGVYFLKLQSEGRTRTVKTALVK